MSDIATSTSDALHNRQRAFLLHQLATAPDRTLTQAAANKALKPFANELNLPGKAANDLRRRMVDAGWLSEAKGKRVITFTITEAGRQQLSELERHLPLLFTKGTINKPTSERTRIAREIYVLSALARAPQSTISKADLEVGFGGKGKPKVAELTAKQPHLAMFRDQHCLELNPATARAVLTELAIRGDIAVHRSVGSESYALTTSGTALLERLRQECPVLPPTGKPTPAPSASVQRGREASVLLKLLQSVEHTLWGSDAATGSFPKPLKLNHATAWMVRSELVQHGYVAVCWDGNEGSYKLTPAGKQYLTTLPFDALGEVKIKGSALTELLAAARTAVKPTLGEAPQPTEPQVPQLTLTAEQLEAAVLAIFHELLRERFADRDLVPIHEIRRIVAVRFGSQAASHAMFDETLLNLRRAKKLRLVSISDRSRATSEQLQDSVVAVGETFFYAEKAHGPAAVG